MPFRTECSSCGKKLQIRDELAGKKVKCPACNTVFVAAGAEAATAVKAGPARSAAGASARSGPPAMSKENVSAKPMAKRPAPPPVEDEDNEELEERPVKSKKRRTEKAGGSLLWVWITAAAVALIGIVVGIYFLFFTGPSGSGPIAQPKTPQVPPANVQAKATLEPIAAPQSRKSLADLVPGDAFFFASVSGEIWNAKALDQVRPLFGKALEDNFLAQFGFPLAELDRASIFTVTSLEAAKQASMGPKSVLPVVIMVQSKKPYDQKRVSEVFRSGELGKNPNMTIEFVDEQTFVASQAPLLQLYKAKAGNRATGALAVALTNAGASKGLVASLIIPPEVIDEARKAPPEAQQFIAPFLKTKAVVANIQLAEKLSFSITVTTEDAAAAQELKKAADGMLQAAPFQLGQFAKDPQANKFLQQTLNSVKLGVQDKEVSLALEIDPNVAMALALPAIQKVREASTSSIETNNLRQLALAWINYHDSFNTFPPQTFNKGLSWRVALLPFIEQGELFKEFNLKEPWDSEHNKKLIAKMPKIYESVGKKAPPGFTYYQTFVGPKTINDRPSPGRAIREIPDGTSNTIILAEAVEPVEWTRPADIQILPSQPITLGGADPTQVIVAFADGSVRRLRRNLDQSIWRLLIDPTDGMRIPDLGP